MQLRCACVEPLLLPAGWSRGFLSFRCSGLLHRALPKSQRNVQPEVLQILEELQGPRGKAAVDVRLKSGKGEKVNLHSQRLVPFGQMMSILGMVT